MAYPFTEGWKAFRERFGRDRFGGPAAVPAE
jgi:hypothetical protein